ncbi:MAG: hypothetical protein QME60_00940 [Verrucomicrobiota bacterium]|nr:hypothetical protein [Verrucomicrobiota bacterium]
MKPERIETRLRGLSLSDGYAVTRTCRLNEHRHSNLPMFEAPSACLKADALYREIDFGSIGSNDLTQYLFTVDRDNDLVSCDYNSDRPVFWDLIAATARAARRAGKPLSICGELAGAPRFTPRLIELGVDTVSVSPRRIAAVRRAARQAQSARVPRRRAKKAPA